MVCLIKILKFVSSSCGRRYDPFYSILLRTEFLKVGPFEKEKRSTMADGRINSLMIGYSERDVIEILVTEEMDSLVTLFTGKERRINL